MADNAGIILPPPTRSWTALFPHLTTFTTLKTTLQHRRCLNSFLRRFVQSLLVASDEVSQKRPRTRRPRLMKHPNQTWLFHTNVQSASPPSQAPLALLSQRPPNSWGSIWTGSGKETGPLQRNTSQNVAETSSRNFSSRRRQSFVHVNAVSLPTHPHARVPQAICVHTAAHLS